MRHVIDAQRQFGQVDIADIVFDPKSRDDIPQLLRGLQHLYTEPAVRERVFASLAEVLPERAGGDGLASPDTGRPGMPQWTILVLGTLRLGLNADYDRSRSWPTSTPRCARCWATATGPTPPAMNCRPSRTTSAYSRRNCWIASIRKWSGPGTPR